MILFDRINVCKFAKIVNAHVIIIRIDYDDIFLLRNFDTFRRLFAFRHRLIFRRRHIFRHDRILRNFRLYVRDVYND